MNTLLWIIIPYVSIAIFIGGHIWRYHYDKFGWTTRSSQLYENRLLRLGSPLFHFGILLVILGHIGGILIPESATSAIGISETAYHAAAVTLGAVSGLMTLVGVAILIAVAGIATAWTRLNPATLVPKREAPPEEGVEKVLADKYYVDEIYDDAIVKPVVGVSRQLLWRGIDVGVIDGLGVNGSAYFARFVGFIGSQFQSGRLGTYAWVLTLGVLAVLGAFTIR